MADKKDNDRKTNPPFGDTDPAPILQTPRTQRLTEAEYQSRYGPPYGPCGVPCDCDNCRDYREELRKQGPSKPINKEAKYRAAIAKIISNEPREAWRDAIRKADCFVREWFDPTDGSFCSQLECDLRELCQATWESVDGDLTLPGEMLAAPARVRVLGKKKKRGRPPGKSKKKRWQEPKWEGTGKYERVPYVSTGRPVDLIAQNIFEYLGMPAHLPTDWFYGPSRTQAELNQSREAFVGRFGEGLYITQRSSYHQYLLDGEHLMRLWVNAAGGGWLDCSRELSRSLLRAGTLDLVKTPASGRSTKFKFYPYRTFISRKSVEDFKNALTNHEKLAHCIQKIEQD